MLYHHSGGYLTDEAWGMFVLDNFDAEFQDLADECLREVRGRVCRAASEFSC